MPAAPTEVQTPGAQAQAQPEHDALHPATVPATTAVPTEKPAEKPPETEPDLASNWVEECALDCWGGKVLSGIKNGAADVAHFFGFGSSSEQKPANGALADQFNGQVSEQLLGFNPSDKTAASQFWSLENTAAPPTTDTSKLPSVSTKMGDDGTVSIKKDASGKVAEIKSTTGKSTTTIDNGLATSTGPDGTIISGGDGRVIDKSADGNHVYQRLGTDGPQRYVEKNGIGVQYSAKKQEADVQMPGDNGVKVTETPDGSMKDFNGKKVFTSKQASTDFTPDQRAQMPEDTTYMFTDGVAMVKHDGSYYIYKKDGDSEVRTKAGNFHVHGQDVTFSNRDHDRVAVTNTNVARIQNLMQNAGVKPDIIHRGQDGGPPVVDQAKQQGVAIDNSAADAVKVTIPDATTTNDTATATLTNGQVQTDVPNQYKFIDTPQGETAVNEQPGADGAPLFNYSYTGSDAGSFYTPDVTFNSNGSTDLDWDGTSVNSLGQVDPGDGYSSYSQLTDPTDSYDNYSMDTDSAADVVAQSTSNTADSDADSSTLVVTADATNSSNNIDVNADMGSIVGSREEVEAALSRCVMAGNLSPLGDLEDDLGELDHAQGDLAAKASRLQARQDQQTRLKNNGVDDDNAIASAQEGDWSQVRQNRLNKGQAHSLQTDSDDDERQTA